MPLTLKGKKILSNMKKEYGEKKGKQFFYASENKGTIKGVAKEKPHSVITTSRRKPGGGFSNVTRRR